MNLPVLLNSKGQPVVLNAAERSMADYWQRRIEDQFKTLLTSNPQTGDINNALGFDISITALTTVVKQVSEQKFYRVPFAKYLPVRVGQGAWSLQLTTFTSFQLGDAFETGIIATGANGARMAGGDVGVQAVNVAIKNWCKGNGHSIFDLNLAAKAGNWDIVVAKEEQRKTNWDLGLQQIAFLGISGDPSVLGLLTQSDVNYNTDLITQNLSNLTPGDFGYFCANVLDAYRSNCARTAFPTHFIMPESDYLGMAAPINVEFGAGKTRLQLLKDIFNTMIYGSETANKFEILPLAYADQANSGFSYQQYTLLNYDEKSVRMDIPVDYTPTLMNTINGFNFENAAYGQFTGVKAYRPTEMLYFKF